MRKVRRHGRCEGKGRRATEGGSNGAWERSMGGAWEGGGREGGKFQGKYPEDTV